MTFTTATLYLDRFEEGYAVLYSPDEQKLVVDRDLLPKAARPDSRLFVRFTLDKAAGACYD